jgi:hypothetical protein
VGTLLLALPVLWFAEALHLPALAALGDRLAALALLATAAWTCWQARHDVDSQSVPAGRTAMGVGFVHGITGAVSLLLVLPMAASGSRSLSAVFLLAFALGSTLGMAALTSFLARVGARLQPKHARHGRQFLAGVTAALALVWLLA